MESTVPARPRRTAVVTGAAGGIGLECARLLLARGDAVALLDRDRRALRAVTEELRREAGDERVVSAEVDVADGFALREARDDVATRLGTPVDVVVAGAGTMAGGSFADGVPGEWADMIEANLTGMLGTAQTFLRDLLAAADAGGPSDLVLVGAIAGSIGFPGSPSTPPSRQPSGSSLARCAWSSASAACACTRCSRASPGPASVRR